MIPLDHFSEGSGCGKDETRTYGGVRGAPPQLNSWRGRLLDYAFALLFLSSVLLSFSVCLGALAWWLFCNFGFSVGLCGFANVPPNALAVNQILSLLSFDVS
jgi:hypothetical protein